MAPGRVRLDRMCDTSRGVDHAGPPACRSPLTMGVLTMMSSMSPSKLESGRSITDGPPTRPKGHYALIDLFAGSGAFTLGLRQAGVSGRALLVDHASDCVATCEINHPDADVVRGDVGDIDWSGATADVVVGGPPCQGFSTLGRRDDSDPRNLLYQGLVQCVQRTKPDVVLVENVARFLDVQQGVDLIESLTSLGYHVRAGVLDAVAFGTPQKRKRALVAAARPGVAIPWPVETHGPGLKPLRTVADAFAMLPRMPDGKNWHVSAELSSEYVERARAIPAGGSRIDLPDDLTLECWRNARGHSDVMGRLRWSKPANTLRTEFHRPEKGRFLHPSEDRSISIREGARLQSFPDSYHFPEDLAFYTIARQVGNAIPVTLARALGRAVITSMNGRMPYAASV